MSTTYLNSKPVLTKKDARKLISIIESYQNNMIKKPKMSRLLKIAS